MKKLILNLLRFYQKYLSLDNLGFHICRYSPTCSEYTHQAVSKYGVAKGSFMGLLRVLRCNPLSKGGFDPVR